jgi:hypothetical protein
LSCKQVDENFDCNSICAKLKDCEERDLSVDSCRKHCYDAVSDSKDLGRASDDCNSCIGDHSCSDIPDSCSTCNDVLSSFTDTRFGGPSGS